jgi:hypothetical protein
VVEQGTHDELMQQAGLYKQLRDLQNRRRVRRLAEAPSEDGAAEGNGAAVEHAGEGQS